MLFQKKPPAEDDVRAARERLHSQKATLTAKLAKAEQELAKLTARLAPLTLDYELSGSPDAQDRLEDAKAEIAEATARCESLRLALAAQNKAIDQFERDLRNKARQSQIAAAQRHLKLRVEAAKECSEHLAKAIAAYRRIIEHSTFAKNNLPDLADVAIGAAIHAADINKLVGEEIFRLSAQPGTLGPQGVFPGAKVDLLNVSPDAVPPLADRLATAGDGAMAIIKHGHEATTVSEAVP